MYTHQEEALVVYIKTLEAEGGRVGRRAVAKQLREILDALFVDCDCCEHSTNMTDEMASRCANKSCLNVMCKKCTRESLLQDDKICALCEAEEDVLREVNWTKGVEHG